jgi:hypothetical protein
LRLEINQVYPATFRKIRASPVCLPSAVHDLPFSGIEENEATSIRQNHDPSRKESLIEEKNATPDSPMSRSTLSYDRSSLVCRFSRCKPNCEEAKGLRENCRPLGRRTGAGGNSNEIQVAL